MKFFKSLSLLTLAFVATHTHAQDFRPRKTDFASIYNEFRFAQPKNVPWAGSYFAFANDGIAVGLGGGSPAEKYDLLFVPRSSAVKWEKENHSCSVYKGEEKESCDAWWGHCNAWSAAGIKEPEPRKVVVYKGTPLEVADQKAWITELWMDSGSLFAGNTNKSLKTDSWILDPTSHLAKSPIDYGSGSNFEAFWDVTPRNFFLIFTNYVGIKGMGVVIDRFTGDEVWNQPIVGYRILPIREADILPEVENEAGYVLYPVKIRMKIYWANDGVPEEYISNPFDIKSTSDSQSVEDFGEDYTGRFLSFKLFFDKPLEIEGSKIAKAGRIVGDGIWDHQENPPRGAKSLNHTHPDFIWSPLDLDLAGQGNANPALKEANVRMAIEGTRSGPVDSSVSSTQTDFDFQFNLPDFGPDAGEGVVRQRVLFLLKRDGIDATLGFQDIVISGSTVKLRIYVPNGIKESRLNKLFSEAGLRAI